MTLFAEGSCKLTRRCWRFTKASMTLTQKDIRTAISVSGEVGLVHAADGLFVVDQEKSVVDWTLQLDGKRQNGRMILWFRCGVRDKFQAIALKMVQQIEPAFSRAVDEAAFVIVSADAGRWIQGGNYRGVDTNLYSQGAAVADEAFVEKSFNDVISRAIPVWRTFRNHDDIYRLLLEASDPFPDWCTSNALASAALMIVEGVILGRPVSEYEPVLRRLWRSIIRDAGHPGLDIADLISMCQNAALCDAPG